MQTQALLKLITDTLEDVKALDVVYLDVNQLTSIADYMIICTGTSNRHVQSLASRVDVACRQAGEKPLGIEGEETGEWVLVDLGDIIVHIMQPETREFYHLEKLWGSPDLASQVN